MGKRKLKGGFPDENYDKGGIGIKDVPENIIGLINYTIGSITSSVNVLNNIMNLPNDMGTAFSETNPPTPDTVNEMDLPKI